jgi:hypothetical protein
MGRGGAGANFRREARWTMRVSPRGRAILQPISTESHAERTYRPGDFVLTRSGGLLAQTMGLATASTMNHAALIVDSSGGLIEVNPFFVTQLGGLRRSHIYEYLDRGAPVWVGYVELLDGTRSEVVRFAEQMLEEQRRFTEWQFAGLLLHLSVSIAPRSLTGKFRALHVLHGLFDHHALVLKEENIFTSAELIARALERGGFLWECDPAYMTPAALFERFCPSEQAPAAKRVALPKASTAKVRAVTRAASARRVWRPEEEGEGAALLPQESGAEQVESSETSAAPELGNSPSQGQVAWGVGVLVLGGALMALGLGWVARLLGGRAE